MTNELTPRDDNRKRVSEILKRVDQLIKSHEYEQAQRETERAQEIDPKNVYISAYQERIVVLIEQTKKQHEAEEIRRREEEETRKKLEEERKKQEAIRQQRQAEERARQEEEQRKKKIEDEAIQKKVEEQLRAEREEAEIRRRVEDVRKKASGGTAPKRSESTGFPKVFVIDDDEKLLNILKSTIAEDGYDVSAFTTSDDAYKALKEETPDLILSDINLETSTMGGFSFYEKVRELDHLQEVPFVFLSGLSDEVLVRTGKELGVDDYITKPFSEKHLLAVVKGKIKRYQQLKSRHK